MDPSLDLKHAERVALAALIARVEARDGASAFWVRRANFAALFGRVERTISSWLTALEEKGWITREQGRARWGDFASLTVHLTQEATSYLGLARDSDLSTVYRKKTSHAIGDQGLKQSFGDTGPAARPYGQPAQDRGNEGRTSQRFEAKVPADCALLLQIGLTPAAAFRAMGWATKAGKRLSDVLAVRGDAIRKARTPMAYLKALIASNVDYGSLSAERTATLTKTAEEKAWCRALAAAQAEYADSVVEGKMPNTRLRIWGREGYVMLLVRDGERWRESGSVVGDALMKFWRRIIEERPPTLRGC